MKLIKQVKKHNNMYDVEYEIFKYLNELTSSYYADKVTDFIKENVKFNY